jgi:hypothetical protein
MGIRRCTRLTGAFSRKPENHAAAAARHWVAASRALNRLTRAGIFGPTILHRIRAVREVEVFTVQKWLISALSIITVLAGCLLGAVRGDRAGYLGGTVTAIPKGTVGKLNLEDAAELRFEYKGGVFSVPYNRVTSIEFGQKAGRRVSVAVLVSPLVVSEKKRHFLTLGFTNETGGSEVAVFELAKGIFQTIVPTLEARTGRRAEIDMASTGGGDDDWGGQSHSSEVRHAVGPEANIPPERRLYPVSIMSEPPGAEIEFGSTRAGRTPTIVKVQPNTYRLTLTLTGYKDWTQEITVGLVPMEVKAKLLAQD